MCNLNSFKNLNEKRDLRMLTNTNNMYPHVIIFVFTGNQKQISIFLKVLKFN